MGEHEAPLVIQTPGGLSISYKGRQLYSARDPAALPRKVAERCDKGPGRLHLVPSPLLWYGVGELMQNMGEGSAVLCVEADPQLAQLSIMAMPPELRDSDRLFFVQTDSVEALMDRLQGLGDFRFCSLETLTGGFQLHEELYRHMAQVLASQLKNDWSNRATLMFLGRRWARNIFDNVAALGEIQPKAFEDLRGLPIICGAGPSLEKALPFMQSHRSALSVIACDTALSPLLQAGIRPDLVVCLEAQAYNLGDFTCLGRNGLPLIADLSSHPASFRLVQGDKYLSLVRIIQSPLLDRIESQLKSFAIPYLKSPALGSVGVQAYFVARSLFKGPILASGLDFSYETGKSHARDCPALQGETRRLGRLSRWPRQYASSLRDVSFALQSSPGPGIGRTLRSDPLLLSYASILDEQARADEREGRGSLFDLRGGGPAIGGHPISFEEARSLLRDALKAPPSSADQKSCQEAGNGTEAAKAILAQELRRLQSLEQSMRGRNMLSPELFRKAVEESDFLWWAFPDQGRIRKPDTALAQDFLNRLLPEVLVWEERLESLLTRLA